MNPIGLLFDIAFSAVKLSFLVLAIKHRHDVSGIVWALIYVSEQIHLEPKSFAKEWR